MVWKWHYHLWQMTLYFCCVSSFDKRSSFALIQKFLTLWSSNKKRRVHTNYGWEKWKWCPIITAGHISGIWDLLGETTTNNFKTIMEDRVLNDFPLRKLTLKLILHIIHTIDHKIFLSRLERCGISGTALQLVSSYLPFGKQLYKIQHNRTDPADVSCGVPWGSIFGRLLFLVYINDVPNCRDSRYNKCFNVCEWY